ncbi:hypothetical protein IAU59_007643 [Kwoniella sp. CBS 9459]
MHARQSFLSSNHHSPWRTLARSAPDVSPSPDRSILIAFLSASSSGSTVDERLASLRSILSWARQLADVLDMIEPCPPVETSLYRQDVPERLFERIDELRLQLNSSDSDGQVALALDHISRLIGEQWDDDGQTPKILRAGSLAGAMWSTQPGPTDNVFASLVLRCLSLKSQDRIRQESAFIQRFPSGDPVSARERIRNQGLVVPVLLTAHISGDANQPAFTAGIVSSWWKTAQSLPTSGAVVRLLGCARLVDQAGDGYGPDDRQQRDVWTIFEIDVGSNTGHIYGKIDEGDHTIDQLAEVSPTREKARHEDSARPWLGAIHFNMDLALLFLRYTVEIGPMRVASNASVVLDRIFQLAYQPNDPKRHLKTVRQANIETVQTEFELAMRLYKVIMRPGHSEFL